MKLRPLDDRVVVKQSDAEEKTTGGILLPNSAQDKPSRGKVLSVGDGRLLDNGKRAAMQVKVGNHVLFNSYGPETFKVGDEELLLLREEDILAVIE